MARLRKNLKAGSSNQISTKIQEKKNKEDYLDDHDDRFYPQLARTPYSHRNQKGSLTNTIFTTLVYAFAIVVVLVIGSLCYNGYLETRVYTPFSSKKVVGRSGQSVPERYWGSYRPGVYFGMKTREPYSPVLGLMWYFSSQLRSGHAGIRHWCEQGDNLKEYGWKEHDGQTFGLQDIIDGPFNISTSFVKRRSGRRGGDWTAHVAVDAVDKKALGKEVSLFFYLALDDKTQGRIALSTTSAGMNGYTKELGDFSVRISPHAGEVEHMSHLSTQIPGLDKIKDVVEGSLRFDKTSGKKKIILPGVRLRVTPENPNPKPNFIAYKVDAKVPFTLEVTYRSGAVQEQDLRTGKYYAELNDQREVFHERFENTFHLKEKGFNESERVFAMTAFSNLIGGIGYFFGASSVQSPMNSNPVAYWKAPLYTAVPSRSFFPRGFLWDEGFHDLLLAPWSLDIVFDIMCHWFDLMNVQGWIPREQILGAEALAKVPQEFVVQWNTNANPPTFFITLDFILRNYKDRITGNYEYLDTLERLYPRLQAWYDWFNTTQIGEFPNTYRWRGRDAETERELNPKTLTSGLDDYPRASHPTVDERHLDLRCWMALGAGVMAEISELLGQNGERYRRTHILLKDNGLLNELHWADVKGRYADYGLHTDAVSLVRPSPHSELVRAVLKDPELRFVDSHFGYVSLFPLLLHIIEPQSPKLEQVLRDLGLLWTDYGLQSLSADSPLYMERNTEHDPPYWRGQIWININYLACRALHHYATVEGPYQQLARDIYNELRPKLISNIMKEYKRTGFIWEQYSDKTGEGKSSHPFTGWSSLVVLLMAEIY